MTNHPPVIGVWDDALSCYMPAQDDVCTARWASAAIGRLPGDLCGDPVLRKVGDVGLCAHHYGRALSHLPEDAAEAARRWDADTAEVVYYLRRTADGLVKIGTSTGFRRRLGELRAEHGALQILLTHRGDRGCEYGIHRRFAALRVASSEWFLPRKPLMTWIIDARRRQESAGGARLLPGTIPLAEVTALARKRLPKAGSATKTATGRPR